MTTHSPAEAATLDNFSIKGRSFPPPAAVADHADPGNYDRAADDVKGFWGEQARRLVWGRDFGAVVDWSDRPHARWFVGGGLNVAVNCVDRHVDAGNGGRVAIFWEGEPGDSEQITYAQLQERVAQAAHALTGLGVVAGDRVAIYLPMIPQAVVAMLACARLGAAHSVVFAGFSAEALRSRIGDAAAKVVITADGQYRRGAAVNLKDAVDEAVQADGSPVEKVLVVRRTGGEVAWDAERDVWWHELVDAQPTSHEAEVFDAEQPLFILYTSGTTGKPKGILHTSGGYLTQAAYTHSVVFDLKPESDVY